MMPMGNSTSNSSDGRPTTVGGLPSALGDAALKHAERIQAKQRKKEANAERDQQAWLVPNAHINARRKKNSVVSELEAQRREETAQALYEKMVNGLRFDETDESRTLRKTAKGLARYDGTLADPSHATRGCQNSSRGSLVLMSIGLAACRRRKTNFEVREAMAKKQFNAAVVLQRRVRLFLHRLAILRTYRAKVMRRRFSAARIQNVPCLPQAS